MLIISILILLLAVTSSIETNYNYLADYVKLNRIVFITFILGSYIAYNTLYVDSLNDGIGIYGGVFKITILSQVFDILLFLTGAIVTILTCFVPYNFRIYNDSKLMEYFMSSKSNNNLSSTAIHFKYNFKNYYYEKLLSFHPYNNSSRELSIYNIFIN